MRNLQLAPTEIEGDPQEELKLPVQLQYDNRNISKYENNSRILRCEALTDVIAEACRFLRRDYYVCLFG